MKKTTISLFVNNSEKLVQIFLEFSQLWSVFRFMQVLLETGKITSSKEQNERFDKLYEDKMSGSGLELIFE